MLNNNLLRVASVKKMVMAQLVVVILDFFGKVMIIAGVASQLDISVDELKLCKFQQAIHVLVGTVQLLVQQQPAPRDL